MNLRSSDAGRRQLQTAAAGPIPGFGAEPLLSWTPSCRCRGLSPSDQHGERSASSLLQARNRHPTPASRLRSGRAAASAPDMRRSMVAFLQDPKTEKMIVPPHFYRRLRSHGGSRSCLFPLLAAPTNLATVSRSEMPLYNAEIVLPETPRGSTQCPIGGHQLLN